MTAPITTPAPAPASVSERLSARFGVTLLANVARTGLSLVTGVIVARHLGAQRYGDLWFLMGTMTAIVQLLDLGTSTALFTMLSGRRNGRSALIVYGLWLAGQLAIPALALGLLPDHLVRAVALGHPRAQVLLAFAAAALMSQIWIVIVQLGESLRKTAVVQLAAVAQSIVHLALVLLAVQGAWLSINAVIGLFAAEYLLLTAAVAPVLIAKHLATLEADPGVRATAGAFTRYCAPLGVYGGVSSVYDFTDRWLLQHFAGSLAQGFFTIGQKFTIVSDVASRSVLNAFWKEIAEASERQDRARMHQLYRSVSRCLYWIGTWIAALLIPYSPSILAWTFGPDYRPAWPSLSVMLLLPVQQSLMQIGGVFLQATGRTRLFLAARVAMMLIALPMTYLLLAGPHEAVPGLGLGAMGLALKMLAVQAIGVALQLLLIARTFRWRVDWAHQGVVLAVLAALAGLGKVAGGGLGRLLVPGSPEAAVGFGAALYTAGSVVALLRAPSLMGLTREVMTRETRLLTGALRAQLLGRSRGSLIAPTAAVARADDDASLEAAHAPIAPR